MKHILFVTKANFTSAFQPGRRKELPKALAILGYKVDLLSACYDWHYPTVDNDGYDDVNLIPIGNIPYLMSILFDIKLIGKFAKIEFAKNNSVDYVITDYYCVLPISIFALLKRLKRRPMFFILDIRSQPVETSGFRGIMKEFEYEIAIRISKMLFSGITVITEGLKEHINQKFKVDQNLIGVWSSGASLIAFDSNKIKPATDLDHLKGKFIIMSHGVISQNRGLHQAIEAFERLKNEYPDIVLVIVGDGPARDELIELVGRKGLESQVYIHNAVPYERIADYIAIADVGLIPLPDISWWQKSSPQKLMEYLAMEKPVIVSNIAAHRSVLGDMDCVRYIPSIEPCEIANAIKAFYNKREDLPMLGKSGRRIIEEKYTWESQAKNLSSFLQKLTNAGNE